MNIIGHRGVPSLELENTVTSFKRALNMPGLQTVELDVRRTKDGQLVVCHDADLQRVAQRNVRIKDRTLAQLKKIPLLDGSHILSLKEALEIFEGAMHVIVEIKDEGCGRELRRILQPLQTQSVSIASFKLRELVVYQDLGIRNQLYGLERTKPIDSIHYAKTLRLDGIGLNFWLLNPLTYALCRKARLRIYVYTVNSRIIGQLIRLLYPKADICSDYPQKFLQAKR